LYSSASIMAYFSTCSFCCLVLLIGASGMVTQQKKERQRQLQLQRLQMLLRQPRTTGNASGNPSGIWDAGKPIPVDPFLDYDFSRDDNNPLDSIYENPFNATDETKQQALEFLKPNTTEEAVLETDREGEVETEANLKAKEKAEVEKKKSIPRYLRHQDGGPGEVLVCDGCPSGHAVSIRRGSDGRRGALHLGWRKVRVFWLVLDLGGQGGMGELQRALPA